jgi:hypothetical protein
LSPPFPNRRSSPPPCARPPRPRAHRALLVARVHLDVFAYHLDGDFLRREVLHVQQHREVAGVRRHLRTAGVRGTVIQQEPGKAPGPSVLVLRTSLAPNLGHPTSSLLSYQDLFIYVNWDPTYA